jgi:hypothetical protein
MEWFVDDPRGGQAALTIIILVLATANLVLGRIILKI